MKIFTIGFTKKTAYDFFEILNDNKIDLLIDVRLNNTSQLAGFAKYPDIEYFLKNLCNIKYIHDKMFAPTDELLKDYKSKLIGWIDYENVFFNIMEERDINNYILKNYIEYKDKNICFLCSEDTATNCHRRLIAGYFENIFNSDIIHL